LFGNQSIKHFPLVVIEPLILFAQGFLILELLGRFHWRKPPKLTGGAAPSIVTIKLTLVPADAADSHIRNPIIGNCQPATVGRNPLTTAKTKGVAGHPEALGHAGILGNGPPDPDGLPFVSSSNVFKHHCTQLCSVN
jgi:hypothetical protein